ncbi:MAG: tRNA (cytidine(34)-2'-O)-methyltransferase [Solobacterium sp.]|nr:tRNA (cytidine(34)-2'-O)-methyltransferase [Solobacterium sp.]
MLNIVLYEPEIPQNTGNIMRTAMAFHCRLHLIEPLGFYLDEKHLRRAGMDYRDEIELLRYENWIDFLSKNDGDYYYVTRYCKHTPDYFQYEECKKDIYLIFGKESTGIPKEILKEHLDRCMRIPMVENARSLNLSNSVAIVVYEVMRQLGYQGLSQTEVIKGEDFLSNF